MEPVADNEYLNLKYAVIVLIGRIVCLGYWEFKTNLVDIVITLLLMNDKIFLSTYYYLFTIQN